METAIVYAPEAKRRLAVLAGSYGAAYLYIRLFASSWVSNPWPRVGLCLFTALFFAGAELICRDRNRSAESLFWYGCTLAALAAVVLTDNSVWDFAAFLILHALAVYAVLVRAGCLLEGRSGGFFAADVVYGTLVAPFSRFSVRARTFAALLRERRLRAARGRGFLYGLLAAAVGAGLLFAAACLLGAADDVFGRALRSVLPQIDLDWTFTLLFRLALSIPVGMYLCGLLLGAHDLAPAAPERAERAQQSLLRLRRVPEGVWTAVLALFCLLYASFLALQASYLFGAFFHKLPEGFTVAGYARQGFFETCAVTALSFLLVLLARKTGAGRGRAVRALSAAVLCFTLLLAVTAASKLGLYLDQFGYTPRRVQSMWLVCVLIAGCVLALVRLLAEKHTFRIWLMLAALLLTVTMFIGPAASAAAPDADAVSIPVRIAAEDDVRVLSWKTEISGEITSGGGVCCADMRSPLSGVETVTLSRCDLPEDADLSALTVTFYVSNAFETGDQSVGSCAGSLSLAAEWGGEYPITLTGSAQTGYAVAPEQTDS